MKLHFHISVCFLLSLAVLLVPAQLGAQEQPKKANGQEIEMNFQQVKMANFLQMMAQALNMALVWDERKVNGSITLVSPRTFDRVDAQRIFETVLQLHGFSIVRHPKTPLLQVVPSAEASKVPSSVLRKQHSGGAPEEQDDDSAPLYRTHIVALKYANVLQVQSTVAPLLTSRTGLAVYPPGNMLLIADSETSIQRILNILAVLDVPSTDAEVRVLPMRYANAEKMAPLLTQLALVLSQKSLPGGAKAAAVQGLLRIVAEPRTNALLIAGPLETVERLATILRSLDVPSSGQAKGFKVYLLKHGDAEEIAKLIREGDVGSLAQKDAPQQSTGGRALQVKVTADKATNSLLAFGASQLLETMDRVVEALDRPRPQVFVEALIMEISLEKSLDLGVRWRLAGVGTRANTQAVSGIGFPDSVPRNLEKTLSGAGTPVVGIIGDEIKFGGQTYTSFSAFVRATQQDQDLNVLANPQILTLNNEEAEINVSSVVPVSSKTVTNNQLQTTTEYQFKDIGIILKITPQITSGNRVRLTIHQESSSIATKSATSSSQQNAITTLKRTIDTQVVVANNTTMAIGGLIQDQTTESETRVPCLGDLWGIGWLFRSSHDEVRKTNLIVFIRPRIIISPEEQAAATRSAEERYEAVRKVQSPVENVLRERFELSPPSTPLAPPAESADSPGADAPAE